MDKALKRKWVRALRSGSYRQAREVLRDTDKKRPKYCCLGVLARIQGATWDYNNVPVLDGRVVGYSENPTSFLTPKAAGGMSISVQHTLSDMNDGKMFSRACSFKEIADYIEKKIK